VSVGHDKVVEPVTQFHIALCGVNVFVPGNALNVHERTTMLVSVASKACDEGAATGM
jgi:hypothetical protein